jgi:RimJ/RimL family protein N-acetyltransferase
MSAAQTSLWDRLGRYLPVQFKTMYILLWPTGQPGYEPPAQSCALDDVALHICHNREEIEALCAENNWRISDTDWLHGHFEDKLRERQTAILAFAQGELAHVVWAVVGKEAGKRFTWDPPISLDWERSAVLVSAYTPPRYRGKGLYPYAMAAGIRFLQEMGMTNVYGGVHHTNVASVRGLQKLDALLAAECFRIRLGYHRYGVVYIALLTWGYRPNLSSRWFRRKFSDSIPLGAIPLE